MISIMLSSMAISNVHDADRTWRASPISSNCAILDLSLVEHFRALSNSPFSRPDAANPDFVVRVPIRFN
jgi:hypothetical protein